MSNESSGKSFFHTFISVGMIIFIIAVIFLLFTGIKGCIEYRQVYYPGVGWVTEPRKWIISKLKIKKHPQIEVLFYLTYLHKSDII